MLKFEYTGKPLPQGPGAIALGGMVTGGEVMDARLPGHVHRLFGDLTAHVGIQPQGRRLLDEALGRPGAPADALDGPVRTSGNPQGARPRRSAR